MKLVDFAPHNLTSNASTAGPAPFPYVVSPSTFYDGPRAAYKAFDGATGVGEHWMASTSTGWIGIYIGSDVKILHSYSLVANSVPEPNKAPKDWTMEGSTDNTTWVVLDTETDQTSWGSGEVRNFICDSSIVGYNFFRVNVTANNGDTYLAIAEIYLYEKTDYVSDRKDRFRTTGVSIGKHTTSTIRGIPAIEVVDSPTITGSTGPITGANGYDSDLSNSAYIQLDVPCWIQIDFGINVYIEYVRIDCGYGALSHTWTLARSTNGSDFTTIATWTRPLYQYDWSPWFPVGANVRYIRTSKTAPNWLAQRGMEVLLSQKPANYIIAKGRDRTRTRGISWGGN